MHQERANSVWSVENSERKSNEPCPRSGDRNTQNSKERRHEKPCSLRWQACDGYTHGPETRIRPSQAQAFSKVILGKSTARLTGFGQGLLARPRS
jgi:hypothetical protein